MKKFLSLFLALVMTMSLVTISAGAKDFTDDESIQYDEAIDVMSAIGVIDGYTDGSFKPTTQLNRGQAAKILCNMILGPTTAKALKADAAPFKDVAADSTFAAYIAYCAKEGIIDGYTDGTFRPSAPLTGYAFMKLLLGALGYDKDVEGYNQPNWSINVAKQALAIDLDSGLKGGFDGTKIVTREEACLYALNTLKATMVEYDSKTSINVGGAEVIIAGTKAKPVNWDEGIKNDGNIEVDGMVQFAEKYFSNLVKDSTSDDFMRPATIWTLKGKEIDTYTKEADIVYDDEAKSGDVYKALGLTKANTVTAYYEDGLVKAPILLEKGNVNGANTIGDKGVTTYVYYNSKTDKVTICEVNTYVGEISATYKATANKDAYAVVAQRDTNAGNTPYASLSAFATHSTFDTDAFAVEDIVLFTYSNKPGSVGIKSLDKAETVEGELTNYTTGKQAVVGGETYKYAAKIASEATTAFINKGVDCTIVLDQYGNAIDVTDKGVVNYAVVLKLKTDSGDWGTTNKAELLLTDGTTAVVTLTNSKNGVDTVSDANGATIDTEDIVAYTVNNKDKYTLTNLSDNYDSSFTLTNGNAAVTTAANAAGNGTANYTANGKSIFLVKSGTVGDPIYTAYTGIKAVPSMTLSAATTNTVYAKTNPIITVMYIDTINTAAMNTKDVIFVKVGSSSPSTVDTVSGTYYIYDAIVNGEVTKLNVDSALAKSTLFNSVSYTTYTNGAKVATLTGGVNATNPSTGNAVNGMSYVTGGTDKLTNGAIGLGNSWYVPADDCQVFYVDADKKISDVSTVSTIAKDADDVVYFKVENGEVTFILIDSLPKNSGNIAAVDPDIQIINADAGNNYANPTFYIADGTPLTTAAKQAALTAQMKADGCTNISWSNGSVTFTKGGMTTTTAVTPKQTYALTIGANTYYLAHNTVVNAANGAKNLAGTKIEVTKISDGTSSFQTAAGYQMPAYDIEIVEGYESLTVTADVTQGASHNNFTAANLAAANKDATQLFVKTGDTVVIKITANTTAITGTGATITSSTGTVTSGADTGAVAIGGVVEVTVTLGTVSSATTITLTATDKA